MPMSFSILSFSALSIRAARLCSRMRRSFDRSPVDSDATHRIQLGRAGWAASGRTVPAGRIGRTATAGPRSDAGPRGRSPGPEFWHRRRAAEWAPARSVKSKWSIMNLIL